MILQSPIPTRGFMWTVTMVTPNNTSVQRITPLVRWSCLFQSFPPCFVSCINSCVHQSMTLWVACGHTVSSVAHLSPLFSHLFWLFLPSLLTLWYLSFLYPYFLSLSSSFSHILSLCLSLFLTHIFSLSLSLLYQHFYLFYKTFLHWGR